MVTLESRWKTNRRWNAKSLAALAFWLAICLALVGLACLTPAMFRRVATLVPAKLPMPNAPPVEAPPPTNDALVEQFEDEIRLCGYTFVRPKGFQFDLLPQPGDVPRGGRFTGFRFRGPWGDAAQLHLLFVEYPKDQVDDDRVNVGDQAAEGESNDERQRLEAALDRLFTRLKHNAATVRFKQGTKQFGELDGMPFVRTGFSGKFLDKGSRTRVDRSGVALVTTEPNRDIFFFSLWEPSIGRPTYDLLETSLFTLRPVATGADSQMLAESSY